MLVVEFQKERRHHSRQIIGKRRMAECRGTVLAKISGKEERMRATVILAQHAERDLPDVLNLSGKSGSI